MGGGPGVGSLAAQHGSDPGWVVLDGEGVALGCEVADDASAGLERLGGDAEGGEHGGQDGSVPEDRQREAGVPALGDEASHQLVDSFEALLGLLLAEGRPALDLELGGFGVGQQRLGAAGGGRGRQPAAVQAAVDRFGRIDVLVNNAGNFQPGFFEEVSDQQFRAQMETNFFGPLNVTRAVLPIMRRQRSGHVVTITSTAGIVGGPFATAYAASKFALEGWTEGLRVELLPFGIKVTAVEPGFFRTQLLVEGSSTIWPELSIDDYAAETAQTIQAWKSMNGQQIGDPAKLAASLVKVVQLPEAPARWVAGADAVEGITDKGRTLIAQAQAHLDLSTGLEVDTSRR